MKGKNSHRSQMMAGKVAIRRKQDELRVKQEELVEQEEHYIKSLQDLQEYRQLLEEESLNIENKYNAIVHKCQADLLRERIAHNELKVKLDKAMGLITLLTIISTSGWGMYGFGVFLRLSGG